MRSKWHMEILPVPASTTWIFWNVVPERMASCCAVIPARSRNLRTRRPIHCRSCVDCMLFLIFLPGLVTIAKPPLARVVDRREYSSCTVTTATVFNLTVWTSDPSGRIPDASPLPPGCSSNRKAMFYVVPERHTVRD